MEEKILKILVEVLEERQQAEEDFDYTKSSELWSKIVVMCEMYRILEKENAKYKSF